MGRMEGLKMKNRISLRAEIEAWQNKENILVLDSDDWRLNLFIEFLFKKESCGELIVIKDELELKWS